ncbi:hypothetical protein LCGC14_1743760 [marine sediment metagenome]|uniref:Uncharacterized protein n=1 Tax=marine sediment metagenome TaxID=412755 RepID=A0A0F9H5U5_9ZZZZ
MTAGQPTKYKTEYGTNEFVEVFIEDCISRELLVSLCRLACYIGVCEDTLQEWGKIHPKFSVSMQKIKQVSKDMLLNKGLTSKYSPNLARFVLSACHGMAERTETTHDLSEATVSLLGLIDGNSKGKLPNKGEEDV